MQPIALLLLIFVPRAARATEAGSAGCPCISDGTDYQITDSPGADAIAMIAGEPYNYGPSYGIGACARHDEGLAPFCDVSDPPGWCVDAWCYVHADCDTSFPPSRSSYFPNAYYSYATCGARNTFAEWFESEGGTHELSELAGVLSSYVKGLVETLESSESELRMISSDTACSYEASCPDNFDGSSRRTCCGCSSADAWGDAPELTYDRTTLLPLYNGPAPAVDACLNDIVAGSFQRIASTEGDASRVGYQYYGSTSGSYIQWPGMSDCGTQYDPRFRPWYAGAAAGPKDVVIVVDTSGSMLGTRIELAIDAAAAVIDTLTDVDYAMVIGFSDTAKRWRSGGLVKMTKENRASAKDWIRSSLRAVGKTSFVSAFQATFDVLTATGVSSNCNRVVLFLSDGIPDSWSDADYANTQAQLAALGHAHLLTYALGSGVDTAIMHRLACENAGIIYEVPDDANLSDIMAEYYKLLATMIEPCEPRWIEYEDVYTGVTLLASCTAAYRKLDAGSASSCSNGTFSYGTGNWSDDTFFEVPKLIGVACIDMSLIVEDATLRAHPGFAGFQTRIEHERTVCPRRTLSEGQLELLRRDVSPSAQCTTRSIPAHLVVEPTYAANGEARRCSEEESKSQQANGAIIGIVLASAAGALCVCVLSAYVCKKACKSKQDVALRRPSAVQMQITSTSASFHGAEQPVVVVAQPAVSTTAVRPSVAVGHAVPMGKPVY